MKIKETIGVGISLVSLFGLAVGTALLEPTEKRSSYRSYYDRAKDRDTIKTKLEHFRNEISNCDFDTNRSDLADKIYVLGKSGSEEDKIYAIKILEELSAACTFSNTKRFIAKKIMDI